MVRRVLILGAGPHAGAKARAARNFGCQVIAMDPDPGASWFAEADLRCVADYRDLDAIMDAAQTFAVDGICAADASLSVAIASACTVLGLPGATPETALRTCNAALLYEAFDLHSLATPLHRVADTAQEAEAAARELKLPVTVRPIDAFHGAGARTVEHIEDIALAVAKAKRVSEAKLVMVESRPEGVAYYVDGVAHAGRFFAGTTLLKASCLPPFHFDMGVAAPAVPPATAIDTFARGLDAIRFRQGAVHGEVVVTPQGAYVTEIEAFPICERFPIDMAATAGLDAALTNVVRAAIGEEPEPAKPRERAAALQWMTSRSGVVTEVCGIDGAREIPGVERVAMFAKPGDVMRHVVDEATRDQVGYVVATGARFEEARAAAQKACDCIEIVTRPAL